MESLEVCTDLVSRRDLNSFWWAKKFGVESKKLRKLGMCRKLGELEKLGAGAGAESSLVEVS